MPYAEFRYYSPLHDCEMCRLSMSDDRGQEFFALVPSREGKNWRLTREMVLDSIEDAIDAKREPGEVAIDVKNLMSRVDRLALANKKREAAADVEL